MAKRNSRRASALSFWIFLIVLLVAFAATTFLLRNKMESPVRDSSANGVSSGNGAVEGAAEGTSEEESGNTDGEDEDNEDNTDNSDNEDNEDQDDSEDVVENPGEGLGETNEGPSQVLETARDRIVSMIRQDRRLSPLFLRLGFRDCIGGCDGCIDLQDVNNRGLARPVDELRPVVEEFAIEGVTRADIWALAATVGADMAQGREEVEFEFATYGRVTCEDSNDTCRRQGGEEVPCDETHGPFRPSPSPDLTTHGLLTFFDETFGFSMEETIAIMGAHTLGRLRRDNSGFDGTDGWVRREDILDNEYYEQLVGGESSTDSISTMMDGPDWYQIQVDNSDIPGIPHRHQWTKRSGRGLGSFRGRYNRRNRRLGRGGGGGGGGGHHGGGGGRGHHGGGGGGRNCDEVMMNADIGLVRDMDGFMDPSTGEVSCDFKDNDSNDGGGMGGGTGIVCPVAHTLPQMAVYRDDNLAWLTDFERALRKMLLTGFTVTEDCSANVCRVTDDEQL